VPVTRGDIADYLGLTVETLSRTLTRLRAEGLIDVPAASELVIYHRQALESLAASPDRRRRWRTSLCVRRQRLGQRPTQARLKG
jgi:DNA-binding transcriptional ArsR family regulator